MKRDEINKYMKKCVKLVISKNYTGITVDHILTCLPYFIKQI